MEEAHYTFLGSNLELVLTTTTITLMPHTPQPTDVPRTEPQGPRELQWLNCFRFRLKLSERSGVIVSLLLTLTGLHCHLNKSHIYNLINNKIRTILSELL